ncbi:MAG: glycosyltransferase family 2 protein [Halioglobus sp.]|nr:glycosyltransferase family 2 protein [Halioglobus sp.]
MQKNSVCAGVVAHNPKVAELTSLVKNLLGSAEWVVVIDNDSSDTRYMECLRSLVGVTVIRNASNRGVSGGINQVIERAREVGAQFVVAFDQDTQITEDLINVLVSDFHGLLEYGAPVAAIGPAVTDDYTGYTLPFVRFRLPSNTRYSREALVESQQQVECDFLISSGCLMSIQAIEEIGGMNEALFIDNVDLEWCFRARRTGYKIYGDFSAGIRQQIGESYTRIPFTNSVIRYHDYARNYYMTRNRVWLYRQGHTNTAWIVHDLFRFICKFMYLLVFKSNRLGLLKSSLRGIIDSFDMKPYDASSS